MNLSHYLKSQIIVNMLDDDVINVKELHGGMSSNKCFHVKTDRDNYTLIVFREDKRTDQEILGWHQLTDYLKDFTPTVRRPIGRGFERFSFEGKNLKTFLYNYIEGKTIQWSAYNSNEVMQLGKVMCSLHDKVEGKIFDLPDWDDLVIQELESFLTYTNFANPFIEEKLHFRIDQKKLSTHIRRIIHFAEKDKKKTILHYDLQRANLIFKENVLNGIIDFEKACIGPREADIAKSCAYLMLDKKWHSSKYLKYYFLKGYGKEIDEKMLHALIIHHYFMELKNWLYNTPFESLPQNRIFNKILHYLMKNNYVQQI